jgi:hypothetical protein
LKLYVTPLSPYAWLTRIVVLEKGLDARVEVLEARTRVARSPYYAINPSRRWSRRWLVSVAASLREADLLPGISGTRCFLRSEGVFMKHREETLIGFDGRELFFQSWEPEGAPRAVIAIVHGGFEHSGHYGFLVDSLVDKGFALAGLDLRGHGESKGKRCHLMDWNEIREDMGSYLSNLQKEFPGRPLFLFGHSMGAAIALDYGLRRSPAAAGSFDITPILGN